MNREQIRQNAIQILKNVFRGTRNVTALHVEENGEYRTFLITSVYREPNRSEVMDVTEEFSDILGHPRDEWGRMVSEICPTLLVRLISWELFKDPDELRLF